MYRSFMRVFLEKLNDVLCFLKRFNALMGIRTIKDVVFTILACVSAFLQIWTLIVVADLLQTLGTNESLLAPLRAILSRGL